MHLDAARPFRRGFTTNQVTGFNSFIGFQAAKPDPAVLDGVVDLAADCLVVPQYLKLVGVGIGSDNDAFTLRVYGWSRVLGSGNTQDGWLQTLLASLSFTLSATVGVASRIVPSTERIADTVTIVAEGTITADVTRMGTVVLNSPTGEVVAFALVPVRGYEMVQFDADDTTGTPTMNVLYAPL